MPGHAVRGDRLRPRGLDAPDANSTEFNAFTSVPVIDLLPEQRDIENKGGTMRLGVYPCKLAARHPGRGGVR